MSTCRTCCAVDVAIPGDLDGGYAIYATQPYSFVITTCPIGVVCPTGLLPQTVNVINVPPVIVPPNPRVLSLQGCQSLITATVPAGSSASVIAGIAAGMQQQWASQQATCNLIQQFNLRKKPTVIILPTIALNSSCPNVAFTQTLPGLTGIDPTQPIGVVAGALPAGLNFTQPSPGVAPVLSGTPTTAGSYNFTFQGISPAGVIIQQPYTQAIIGTSNLGGLPTAMENTAYNFQFAGAGGTAPYTFTLATGTLPGITLSPSGLLSGTPNYVTAGSYPFSVTITDTLGNTCTQTATLVVTLRPGPDWTQLAWTTYQLNPNLPNNQVTGQGIKNTASGQIIATSTPPNPSISPVAASGVTYTGPQVTSRIILTVTNTAFPGGPMACRVFRNGAQIQSYGQAFASGTYTFDFVVPVSVGATFTIDDASPGNSWAIIAGGGTGNLSFTWAIVNV